MGWNRLEICDNVPFRSSAADLLLARAGVEESKMVSRRINPRCIGSAVLLCALILICSASAQFETRGSYVADSTNRPSAIAVGDFNHDGILDLAVASGCCSGGGVSILLGREIGRAHV